MGSFFSDKIDPLFLVPLLSSVSSIFESFTDSLLEVSRLMGLSYLIYVLRIDTGPKRQWSTQQVLCHKCMELA